MQAMQYDITLPADYDMEIIRRRVRDRGSLTDDFPHLAFKAYCISDAARTGQPNAYAPFYLWTAPAGMAEFLFGDPFAGLSASFGRPRVDHWLGLTFTPGAAIGSPPRSATRHVELIAPTTDLRTLRDTETVRSRDTTTASTVHSRTTAVDPVTWQVVRFTLWTDAVDSRTDDDQRVYEVLHVSRPRLDGLARRPSAEV